MKKFNKKGFTMVELVVVIAVIAILAAVLIPTFSNVVDKANESKAMQEAKAAYDVWYANYLAENATAYEGNMCIFADEDNKYIFHVVGGQFKTENVAGETHGSCTNTVTATVSDGDLTVSGL